MRKVYVFVHNTSYADPDIRIYNSSEPALSDAIEISRRNQYDKKDIGFLLYAEYSIGGDYVVVAEKEIK